MTVVIVASNPLLDIQDHSSLPGATGVAVSKSDTDDLAICTKQLYVGVAGDIKVNFAGMIGGSGVVLKAVPVGLHNLRLSRIFSTGTGATDMVAIY